MSRAPFRLPAEPHCGSSCQVMPEGVLWVIAQQEDGAGRVCSWRYLNKSTTTDMTRIVN